MQLLRVLLSATLLVAPSLALQQAEGGITCSIKHSIHEFNNALSITHPQERLKDPNQAILWLAQSVRRWWLPSTRASWTPPMSRFHHSHSIQRTSSRSKRLFLEDYLKKPSVILFQAVADFLGQVTRAWEKDRGVLIKEQVCSYLGGQLENYCIEFLAEYTDDIIDMLVNIFETFFCSAKEYFY